MRLLRGWPSAEHASCGVSSLTKRGCYGEESEEEDREEERKESEEVEEVTSFFGRAGPLLRSHLWTIATTIHQKGGP
jgi:hypothetical protein